MYYGLRDLDQKVEHYVDFDGGVFFEAGANDGLTQSNTAHFEKDRDWRGVLVEPIPHRYLECSNNRPNAFVELGALVPADWSEGEVELIYCNLMTTTKGAFASVEADFGHANKGLRTLRGKEDIYVFKARPLTISGVLDKYGVSHVDFMSLDMEGFEQNALKGMDMTRHRPTWLLVEERRPDALKAMLDPYYDFVETLTVKDYLFRAKA